MSTVQDALARASTEELVELYIQKHRRRGQIYDLYPDTGPLRRELYAKHVEAFALGNECMIRAAQSANGVGKTLGLGGYEVALHLTGLYTDWWPGFRYERATRWWAAGDSHETTRDTIQTALFGEPGAEGTGLIPGDLILDIKWRSNKKIDYALIRHVPTGGASSIGLKAYEQGEDSFRGPNRDGIWLDEPPPYKVFSEALARLRGGPYPMMILTYTPMDGITPLTLEMEKQSPERRLITITWDDVPHLTEAYKTSLLANTSEHLRETRRSGVPSIGEGAVFPIDLDSVLIDPLDKIPDHWPRICGFDGGYHNTAALWAALDRDSDTIYCYTEHKPQPQPIAVHAAALKARGDWIPIVGDAAGINQEDGRNLVEAYSEHDVDIILADKHQKSVSIDLTLERFLTGRLKIYKHLVQTILELRQYRYEDQKIVKENDHLMDCLLYLVRCIRYAKSKLEATKASPTIREKTFGRHI